MPIRFRCQDCQSRVKVPEGSQGKQVKCPRCGRIQTVPQHHSQMDDSSVGSLEVHTCVGSIHRAPKRKEALVGSGASNDRYEFSGGGAPAGGSLHIPQEADEEHDLDVQEKRLSRKERRRRAALARQAQREREEMAAREAAANQDKAIAECRKQVEDIFATSRHKDFTGEEPEPKVEQKVEPRVVQTAAATPAVAPKPITLTGTKRVDEIAPVTQPQTIEKPSPLVRKIETPKQPEPADEYGWSFDLTSEAYPFLRIIPWVLRITALMLIGPAFKVMLVADAQGFSGIVCMLILFAGLAMVIVTWTVGEIANAVRDIALKRATG